MYILLKHTNSRVGYTYGDGRFEDVDGFDCRTGVRLIHTILGLRLSQLTVISRRRRNDFFTVRQ